MKKERYNSFKENVRYYQADYKRARELARAILADFKGGEYSVCEFDDSPEHYAIKDWLINFIPAIGGRVYKDISCHTVYCFIV